MSLKTIKLLSGVAFCLAGVLFVGKDDNYAMLLVILGNLFILQSYVDNLEDLIKRGQSINLSLCIDNKEIDGYVQEKVEEALAERNM